MRSRDYVLEPVPPVPIRVSGQATFEELFDVFADHHGVALVGAGDPDMGPYTHCVRVAAADVEAYHKKGYRRLSSDEEDAVLGMPDDFGDATD